MSASRQIALVTGATGGIGSAISVALAKEGMSLWLVAPGNKALEETRARLSELTSEVRVIQADLTVENDLESLVGSVLREVSHLDLLIHAAGVIAMGDIESATVKDFDWQYQVNVRAPYRLTQALLPLLKLCHGRVVFINSSAGLSSRPHAGQYSATKHALRAVADSLRAEVNGDGVRVLSVFPGRTSTQMQESLHRQEGKPYYPDRLIQPEDVAAIVLNTLRLSDSAEVTDVFMRPMMKPL